MQEEIIVVLSVMHFTCHTCQWNTYLDNCYGNRWPDGKEFHQQQLHRLVWWLSPCQPTTYPTVVAPYISWTQPSLCNALLLIDGRFLFQGMKSARVKLMRQMKEESERFRALKAQKEKEINQLKQQVLTLTNANWLRSVKYRGCRNNIKGIVIRVGRRIFSS